MPARLFRGRARGTNPARVLDVDRAGRPANEKRRHERQSQGQISPPAVARPGEARTHAHRAGTAEIPCCSKAPSARTAATAEAQSLHDEAPTRARASPGAQAARASAGKSCSERSGEAQCDDRARTRCGARRSSPGERHQPVAATSSSPSFWPSSPPSWRACPSPTRRARRPGDP